MKRIKIIARRDALWQNDINLFLFTEEIIGDQREIKIAEAVKFTVHHEDACMPPPTVTLQNDCAQQLMDQLWDCGLRPSEGTGSAGAMAATNKHLEDLRKLVFEPSISITHKIKP